MPYSYDFFALQLEFARRVSDRFGLPFTDALRDYTTFTKSFGTGDEWDAYLAVLATASDDPAAATYAYYLPRAGADPAPGDTTFHGSPLFGCFYFGLRDGGSVIRTHLIPNDHSGQGLLSRDRADIRRAELTAMFAHIRAHVPEARTVLGNSWLYNREAYRRLYPPEYTAVLPEGDEGEYTFLARWGQFFDRNGRVKPDLAALLLSRLEALTDLDDLRHCFPCQILRPQCAIEHFYAFYGIP